MTKKLTQEEREELSTKSLAQLRMKNAYFTAKRKAELIGNLTLDDKIFLGSVLNDTDHKIHSGVEELDGDIKFGNKTYEDGVEVFTNNKY